MKIKTLLLMTALALCAAACQARSTVCSPDSSSSPQMGSPSLTASGELQVEIRGRLERVDKVVQGSLCSDIWRGTVYVACGVQVASWEENPTFLDGCDLAIEPGTVVYVAHHNDEAYFKGCSCHYTATAVP